MYGRSFGTDLWRWWVREALLYVVDSLSPVGPFVSMLYCAMYMLGYIRCNLD